MTTQSVNHGVLLSKSESPLAGDWWLAADGLWYPPEAQVILGQQLEGRRPALQPWV
ncbi:MAG: hypothetical protein WBA45_12410 [Microthrixaceae bacterium]